VSGSEISLLADEGHKESDIAASLNNTGDANMSIEETRNEGDNSPRLSRRQIRQHSRQVRLGMTAIPQLESDLTKKLQMLSVVRTQAANCRIELRVIQDSLELIALTIKNTGESLKALIGAIGALENTGVQLEDKIEQLLLGSQVQESVLASLESMGGSRMVFQRMFRTLKRKYDAYVRCIELVRNADTDNYGRNSLGGLVTKVGDCIEEPPGNPRFFVGACLFTPNPLVCAAVVVTVLVVLEGEAGGEEEDEDDGNGELGDFPEPDPGGDVPV
jgi:hypothetical protein